ncbi:MAG TPA: 1-acyl-sn-glycerol-3-phosphate acyltransferase, partial [Burkholderiales bacterium]|nr:1-acyl-sn-glycerol-3-phosphate acyltransferase [Burkholderiales bacterium]
MFRLFAKAIVRALARLLFRVRVEGPLDIFQSRQLLIVANHESFLDGLILGLFLPVDPVFVVHTGVARRLYFRIILSVVDYLPVDPTSPMAMKKVIKLIQQGRPVMIFPEGRITVTGSLMKVYEGPAFVAAKTNATIIPVRLDGPARSYFSRLSGKYPRHLFPRITVSIQRPAHIAMGESGKARERRRLAGEEMRKLMQKMLFDSRPKQTLYSGLLDAISLFGRSRRLIEDITQVEHSYGEFLKMTLAVARAASKSTREG